MMAYRLQRMPNYTADMRAEQQDYQPIENYGIIGNLKTVALVGLNGSIDFMSFPRFDSPTIFAGMLDNKKGGRFSIEPQMNKPKSKQLYIPGTAVLLTRFFSEEGIAELIDFMPLAGSKEDKRSVIIRKIKVIRGTISFKIRCCPRFDYARSEHDIKVSGEQVFFESINDGNAKLKLSTSFPMRKAGPDAYAAIVLKESEIAYIVLESYEQDGGNLFDNLERYVKSSYQETVSKWHAWIRQSSYKGRWQELILRSVITLKLMTSFQFGSAIAAATFGLPETIGGNRNWDYRYTWTRDTSFTMFAFLSLGFFDEATAFLHWIYEMCADQQLQLIYGVDGNTDLTETTLDHLEGYSGSAPVRIGNAAKDQLQIDIYGELIDTIYIYNKSYKPITYKFWGLIEKMVKVVQKDWKQADHGIWEIRNEKKEFLHSRLMCWVAMDRAIKIADHRSFPYPESEWKALRNEIYLDIFDNFWNDDIKAWVQYKGASVVDASVLLMPLTHYISPVEDRWTSTMKAIEERLRLDVLLYRYRNNDEGVDGLDGEEGTFNMCSFWFIEAMAKSGRIEEAVESFEKMIGYANHLGLFSEELGKKGEHLGNFPQAFTHLALISAAIELNKQISRLG